MKRYTIPYILLGIGLVLGSCEKYLDHSPDMRTEINTVEKVAQLVTSAYPDRDYLTFAEAASDNAEDKGNGVGDLDEIVVAAYFWNDLDGDATGTTTQYWNSCYAAIAGANQALESIETNDFGEAALAYKGEALVARAYAHFMLVTFFAQAYEIGGANNTPGVPYVDQPEKVVIKPYDRGTVQSVYDRIEQDLEEGLPLLSATAYSVPKYHFTPAAAHAFAARFYLFKGDWQKVVDHVSAIFPSGDFASNLRPIATDFREYTIAEMNAAYTRADQKYNLLLAQTYSVYQRLSTPRYGFGVLMQSMFTEPNVTGAQFSSRGINYGVPHYTAYKYNEYFYRVSPNAATGFPYIMVPLFTVDEALINRAEAYTQLGQFDKALDDLNTFISTRIQDYNPSIHDVTLEKVADFYLDPDPASGLIKTILDFKKREFIQEGIRWLDILRHDITVRHNVFDENGVETFIELPPGDPRRMFQIPQEAEISGVEQNPR